MKTTTKIKYAYIDGDNIGLLIEKSFMDNNERKLQEVNNNVRKIVKSITFFLKEQKLDIIFSGADGVICKGENIDGIVLHNYIKSISKKITFSIGIGNNLREAFLALRYAKSNNKNVVFEYYNNSFIQHN